MKKMMLCAVVCAGLWACGGNDSYASKEAAPANDVTNDPAFIAGRDLVSKSDCITCHKIDEVATGPAYRKVAEKYANTPENVAMLAGKIIKGGSGNWGAVPMLAHPNLSQSDAETMAKYILMLKK
jgi:cytochrome c